MTSRTEPWSEKLTGKFTGNRVQPLKNKPDAGQVDDTVVALPALSPKSLQKQKHPKTRGKSKKHSVEITNVQMILPDVVESAAFKEKKYEMLQLSANLKVMMKMRMIARRAKQRVKDRQVRKLARKKARGQDRTHGSSLIPFSQKRSKIASFDLGKRGMAKTLSNYFFGKKQKKEQKTGSLQLLLEEPSAEKLDALEKEAEAAAAKKAKQPKVWRAVIQVGDPVKVIRGRYISKAGVVIAPKDADGEFRIQCADRKLYVLEIDLVKEDLVKEEVSSSRTSSTEGIDESNGKEHVPPWQHLLDHQQETDLKLVTFREGKSPRAPRLSGSNKEFKRTHTSSEVVTGTQLPQLFPKSNFRDEHGAILNF